MPDLAPRYSEAHTENRISMYSRLYSVALATSLMAVSVAVTSRAVWRPDNKTLQKARQSCASAAYPGLGECFARQMQQAGASPEAVAFTNRLHNDAYLAKFQDTGRVSIAWIVYPFRANTNTGCLLVNGTPPVADVDDLSSLPSAGLKSDPGWKALLAKHPRAMLWPGDRSGMTGVTAESLPGGGQRFIADYLALDGCHACARLARIHYAFDFDLTGRLLGAHFLNLQTLQ